MRSRSTSPQRSARTLRYVGFTGGTGGSTAIQNIKTWTFTSGTTPIAADPIFNPSPGTYAATQNVSLSSATTGATIYYTVDGSTPTHSSAVYSAPIVVSGPSLTIRAFASATGYQDSPIVVGSYQIQAGASPAATPTFSPASGTSFSSTLSVSIADTTAGAAIYYTTDGSIADDRISALLGSVHHRRNYDRECDRHGQRLYTKRPGLGQLYLLTRYQRSAGIGRVQCSQFEHGLVAGESTGGRLGRAEQWGAGDHSAGRKQSRCLQTSSGRSPGGANNQQCGLRRSGKDRLHLKRINPVLRTGAVGGRRCQGLHSRSGSSQPALSI